MLHSETAWRRNSPFLLAGLRDSLDTQGWVCSAAQPITSELVAAVPGPPECSNLFLTLSDVLFLSLLTWTHLTPQSLCAPSQGLIVPDTGIITVL